MKSLCEEYILPHTVEEAIQILVDAQGSARLIAGGSDLLLDIQQGSHPPVHTLVDVTGIEEMCSLEMRNESLFIGASVTLTRLVNSPLVKRHAQALFDAASLMGNPQVCNVATIGGNVVHALPAADGSIALLALDARAEIATPNEKREVSLQTLFKGPGESALDPGRDLLVGFYLPLLDEGQASAFSRRIKPQGIALAIVNIAIWLGRKGDRIVDARIAAGPSGRVPLRMRAAENALVNRNPSPEVQAYALEELLSEAHFRTSPHRATEEYRRHLAGILLQEALSTAWRRAE